MNDKYNALQRQALSFIILMGVVSLFSDMTYEGARSPDRALPGASGSFSLCRWSGFRAG